MPNLSLSIDELHGIFKKSLVSDVSAWRNTLLIPGNWEIPTLDETATFLCSFSEHQKKKGQTPLPLLFRPLAAKRLKLSWPSINIWQIALNVEFGVGVLDIFEMQRYGKGFEPEEGQPALGKRQKFFKKKKQPYYLASEMFPTSFNHMNKEGNGDNKNNPNAVFSQIASKSPKICKEVALECTTFCLGLSKREIGRLRVLFPSDQRAWIPDSEYRKNQDYGNAIIEPMIHEDTGIFNIDLTVAYGDDLFNVTVGIEEDSLNMKQVVHVGTYPRNHNELLVGPVRVSGMTRPKTPDREKTQNNSESNE